MNQKTKDSHMLVLYNTILDHIDIGIHVIDKYGKTIIYNRKMMEIEGMAAEDVLGKNISDVFSFQSQGNSTLVQAITKATATINVKQTYYNNKNQEITTINDTFPVSGKAGLIGAIEMVKDVTKLEKLVRDNIMKKGDTRYTFESIIGISSAIAEVIEDSKRATRTSSSVLLIGETGTGKELFAQSIHNGSGRSNSPFISQNCAALPDSLIESILFGTKKGAFTGAIERPGLFEQAHGGTLLLDEINSLAPALQTKLLRVIQEKKVRRIGATTDIEIDVRIIATINEDPIDSIAANRLRKDLFYRLSVVSLFIPPLRERKEDISELVQFFIEKYNHLFGMGVKRVEETVHHYFSEYDWPGNVRELEHVIEGSMNFIDHEEEITYNHLPFPFRKKRKTKEEKPDPEIEHFSENGKGFKPLKQYMGDVEQYYIEKVLAHNQGNVSKTAAALGMSRQNLQYRLRKINSLQNE